MQLRDLALIADDLFIFLLERLAGCLAGGLDRLHREAGGAP